MFDVKVTRPSSTSPLRYPGGKSSLSQFLTGVIEAMDPRPTRYIEPFAGGAGAGISLLLSEHVDSIVINDLDPAVHAFWFSLVNNGEEFISKVQEIPLTLDEWRRQRSIYQTIDSSDPESLQLGLAFFFLNRTNRSGILNAGVIGGKSQAGKYKIGARFNRDQLVERLAAIHTRRDSITVSRQDGRGLIESEADNPEILFYVDPPYVQMGKSLYLSAFGELDHTLLANCLNRRANANWILTYDDHPLIDALYADRNSSLFKLVYSAQNRGYAQELMIVSDPIARVIIS